MEPVTLESTLLDLEAAQVVQEAVPMRPAREAMELREAPAQVEAEAALLRTVLHPVLAALAVWVT